MKLAERIFKRNDYVLTSPYGMRTHPITKNQQFHKGADYGTHGVMWPQYALEDGNVIGCGSDQFGYGALYVWIRYPRLGIDVLHYHLQAYFVKNGQIVDGATMIGITGKTGRATGIHLHLQVRNSQTKKGFDPESYDYKPMTALHTQNPTPLRVGDKVRTTGTHYATGQKIPAWVKLRTYTIQKINGNRALLHPIVSWVYLNELKRA